MKRSKWHENISKMIQVIPTPKELNDIAPILGVTGSGLALVQMEQSAAEQNRKNLIRLTKMLDKAVETAEFYEKLRGWTDKGMVDQPLDHGVKAREFLKDYEKGIADNDDEDDPVKRHGHWGP